MTIEKVRRFFNYKIESTEKRYIQKRVHKLGEPHRNIIHRVEPVQETPIYKMALTQNKMEKNVSPVGKLWANEERMFGEKFFYLNKSTTKYVIGGHDPRTLEPMVRICDRVTGSHITIARNDFGAFMMVVKSIVFHSYKLDRGFIEGAGPLCGIKVSSVNSDIWKLTQVDLEHANILIHKSSFKTLLRIERLIEKHLNTHTPASYLEVINDVRQKAFGMDEAELYEYMYDMINIHTTESIVHQVLSDLISNRESYISKKEFCEGLYSRNSYK